MRQVLPYIFWPWFATSCFVLIRRRVTSGGWRSRPAATDAPAVDPPESVGPIGDDEPAADEPAGAEPFTPSWGPSSRRAAETTPAGGVATETIPVAHTLAEALEGIAMPCDLAPLIGTGEVHPRRVDFFTTGFGPSTVGEALADELERLGFVITPIDDTSIRAEKGPNAVKARLVSESLTSAEVMRELHPSAPAGALVVELHLL